ncbi:putative enoyl-(Acyl-carrier-protein reductase II) [Firmicutes bacterium CAG:56]|nr:putative enoyl-(Acyl-carrier-protein reductase II) [Firmicutes bacterium CAG:56]
MAGQSAGLVKQEQTCSEMIEEIMDQAKKLLKEA